MPTQPRPRRYSRAKKRMRELKEQLRYSVSAPQIKGGDSHPAQRSFAKPDYLAAVQKAKDLIAAGDFMQVQVGQRIHKRYTESPRRCTGRCARSTPRRTCISTTSASFQVVGSSPEILVRQEQGGGAARRSPSARWPAPARAVPRPRPTLATEHELLADPKERAEHVMLIDLARNDIGRIAKTGSVQGDRSLCGGALQPRDAHRQQRGRRCSNPA